MTRKSFSAALVSGALVLSMGLVACGGHQETQESPEKVTAQSTETTDKTPTDGTGAATTQQATRKVVGEKTDTSHEVALKNGLTYGIACMRVREAGTDDYGENLLAEGATIAAGEEVSLFLAPLDGNPALDVSVELDGINGIIEFANVPFAELSSATLMSADGVVYVDYVRTDGTAGSTRNTTATPTSQDDGENEPDASDSSGAYDANSQDDAADDAQGADDYATDDADYASPSYDETSSYADQAPADVGAPLEAPTDVDQTTDACMGGVQLRDQQ